jgi:hypothetical protein
MPAGLAKARTAVKQELPFRSTFSVLYPGNYSIEVLALVDKVMGTELRHGSARNEAGFNNSTRFIASIGDIRRDWPGAERALRLAAC